MPVFRLKGFTTSAVLVLCLLAAGPLPGQDSEGLSGQEIVDRVNARNDGEVLTRDMRITMKDESGKTRVQNTHTYRRYYGEEKRAVIFYTDPANVKDTGFLTYDYPEAEKEDDQWLYLPALRRVRRISSSNRGDYYLGTDLTYEDIKLDTRLSGEMNWERVGEEDIDGVQCIIIEATPKTPEIAQELGYSRYRAWVDPQIWMNRRTTAWDTNGNHLKTVFWEDFTEIDGIWSVQRMFTENHKTGHTTLMEFSNIDFTTPIEDDKFTERALKRGVRGR